MNVVFNDVRIVAVMETETIKTFKKRPFVIIDGEGTDFPDYMIIEATGDKTSILDNYKVGDIVTVTASLRGRKWDKKDGSGVGYMVTLNLWKIKKEADEDGVIDEPITKRATAPKKDPLDMDLEELPF